MHYVIYACGHNKNSTIPYPPTKVPPVNGIYRSLLPSLSYIKTSFRVSALLIHSLGCHWRVKYNSSRGASLRLKSQLLRTWLQDAILEQVFPKLRWKRLVNQIRMEMMRRRKRRRRRRNERVGGRKWRRTRTRRIRKIRRIIKSMSKKRRNK